MNAESTPKGAQESATTTPIVAAGTDFTAEDRHAAWLAGVEHGRAERFDLEVKDAVQDALHTRALEALGMARRSAVHGPAFSAMVTGSGQRE